MQKAQNVNKIVFFILLLVVQTSVFSQKTLEGTYRYSDETGEFWILLEFSKNNVFSYESGMDLGTSEYGKGHYTLTKDSLILNFDLTEFIEATYHRYSFYKNNKDSIEIKFRVFTADNSIAKGLNVGSTEDRTGVILEKSNEGMFKLKRENKYKELFFSSIEYNNYNVNIYGEYNYNIDIYLRKKSKYSDSVPLKDIIWKYEVVKNKKDKIELKTSGGGILTLEKDYYTNSSFK